MAKNVRYKGWVDDMSFVYADGELRLTCSPEQALQLMLGLQPDTAPMGEKVAEVLAQELEKADLGPKHQPKIPDLSFPKTAAGPGGSADAATREDADAGPSGDASPAQPSEPGHPKDNVVPIKREDGLPPELAKSPTLKPVIAWYSKKGLKQPDIVQALTEHPAAKKVKDLPERVKLILQMAEGPEEKA